MKYDGEEADIQTPPIQAEREGARHQGQDRSDEQDEIKGTRCVMFSDRVCEWISAVSRTVAAAGIIGVVTLIWGGEYKTYHNVLPTFTLKVGQISVPPESLIGLVVSLVSVAILMFVFKYTKIGLAMRATAEDLRVVQSLGIRATLFPG